MDTPELFFPGRAELAEGPVWHDGALWWVNIVSGTLNRLDVASRLNTSRATGDFLSAAVPSRDGSWLIAQRNRCSRLDWSSGAITPCASISDFPAGNRLNDGKCDPMGNFWVGSMDLKLTPSRASLYRLSTRGEVSRVLQNLTLSNGLVWSPSGTTFYHVDSVARRVTAFDCDVDSGKLANARKVVEFQEHEGSPDGMTIDREGNLWIALWGASSVIRVASNTGKVLSRHALPIPQVSACTFGGAGLSTLFITTAWENLSLDQRIAQPLAGSIFALETDTQGLAANLFGGVVDDV